MIIVIIILSVFVFIKTLGYSIYEYEDNHNKIAGITIGILASISLLAPIIITAIM